MKASKIERKQYSNIPISRKTTKKIKSATKKIKANWLIIIIIFAIGATIGFFANNYAFKNDIYEMVSLNGQYDIILGGMEDNSQITYTELGVKCIAFGKDISEECTVKYYYRADLTQTEREVTIDDINLSNIGKKFIILIIN